MRPCLHPELGHTRSISVSVPDQLIEALKDEAARKKISTSAQLVEMLIERYCETVDV